MKLGVMLGYAGSQLNTSLGDIANVNRVQECEALGYDSVWTAESWGTDAITPLAWIGAHTKKIKLGTGIMQIPGRSPANAAMTAMTLDALSGGRFLMGVGTSGPQVVEGWHGVPFYKSLTWLEEYIIIVRKIFERKEALTFEGVHYQIPYHGPNSSGQGKPLKSMLHGRADIPIYTGSMAPKSQQLAAKIADGCLLTCMHPEKPEVILENLEKGFAQAGGGKSIKDFDLAPNVAVAIGPLEQVMLPLKMQLALYIGGMGSKEKNFYKDYWCRVGFEAECATIQNYFLEGKRNEAVGAVTDAMVDAVYLVGPKERVADRFQRWKSAPIGTMMIGAHDMDTLRFMAELNAR